MASPIENWESLPFDRIEREVFQLQRRIFKCARQEDTANVHKLQKLLVRSKAAKILAVAKVTERNAGRNSAGVDGIRTLNEKEKARLVQSLSLSGIPSPVKRVWIPKPGKSELRPLGIPTIRDRAQQALIALALEPEWEARFSPGSYGFRKGRSAHDALSCIRASIQFKPKWVLDADIEKFFDRVNHAALLRKLETYPAMRTAIRRILKSGVLAGKEMTYPEEGTPQGGPLSPLLANIVLHGIETELRTLSQDWKSSKHRPVVMVRYADDFVVLHEDKEVIQKCGQFIAEWLRPMGLGLHATKTRIVHTLREEAGAVGFDFLGHHIRQFQTGKYAVKPCFNRVHTNIKPSSKSQLRVYERLTETIEKTMCLQALPPDARVRILISRLNSIIRGWCNYFRCSNAKDTFTKLDYLLWRKLWKVLRRLYRKKSRHWIVERYLKDEEDHWSFQCPVADSNHRHQLIRFADTKVKRHYPTRHDQNHFNGDWAYWATRMGRYPGLPRWIGNLLQKQAGKCHHCRVRIHSDHAVARQPARIGKKGAICLVLLHNDCVAEFRQKASQCILAADTVCSPVR